MARIEARTGAVFGWTAVAAWIALYLVAVLSTPGYTITGNRLSDLGNPSQPAPWAFNSACILAGLFFAPFAWAIGPGLGRRTRTAGRTLLTLAAAFLVLLGVFHEGSPDDLHFLFSAFFFLALVLAVGLLGVGMWGHPRYGRVSGLLSGFASGLAVCFMVAVVADLLLGAPLAEGALSNVLEHLTVFAGLAWATWTALRLDRTARAGVEATGA